MQNSFTIYPNPAKEQVTIVGQLSKNTKIELINMLGQKVYQTTITSNNNSHAVYLDTTPAGTYVLKIMSENRTVVNHKIIVK